MGKRSSVRNVVVEFGAREAQSVIQAIGIIVGELEMRIDILRSNDDADFNYAESNLDLREAESALAAGEVTSILASPVEKSRGFFAMVFCPGFQQEEFGWWRGLVDLKTGYDPGLAQRLKNVGGLEFFAVSIEDSLDFPEGNCVTEESFPWEDWRLIEAVVANGESLSRKEIRRGPAARKVLDE